MSITEKPNKIQIAEKIGSILDEFGMKLLYTAKWGYPSNQRPLVLEQLKQDAQTKVIQIIDPIVTTGEISK